VAKVQYWLKITFVFILILFIDSVNRVYRVQVELAAATENSGNSPAYVPHPHSTLPHPQRTEKKKKKKEILTVSSRPAIMGHDRLEVQARKFYSQRNMYLCGFTLFLSLILNRTYIMILETLRLEEKVKQYEGTEKNTKEAEKLARAGEPGEISRLKREVELRDQDITTLKKQAAGLHREYDDLAEKYGRTQQDGSSKKDK
jgi:hypothetical protein